MITGSYYDKDFIRQQAIVVALEAAANECVQIAMINRGSSERNIGANQAANQILAKLLEAQKIARGES